MSLLPEEFFDICMLETKELMGAEYNSWFSTASYRSFVNNNFIIGLDSKIRVDFVNHNYKSKIEDILQRLMANEQISVSFTCDPETLKINGLSRRNNVFSYFIKPEYTFENYIPGPNSNLAYTFAQSVANEMGMSSSNPLFIYGGVGLGKTHLIQAIANHIKKNYKEKSYCYSSSQEFFSNYVSVLASQKNVAREMESFKNKYRNVDYLIMDDIQFMAGKEGNQNVFFDIFNDLFLRGRQIILTSDRPPHEIEPLEERLVSRFQSGMVVDIKKPIYETRVAILKRKFKQLNLPIEERFILYIAETVNSNVRVLQGAANLIAANSKVQNIELSLEKIKEIIKEYLGATSKRLNSTIITSSVADFYDINPTSLKGKKRNRDILIPRQIAMFLIRELTDKSLEEIGDFFDRDHSTVLNSIKRVKSLIEENKTIKRNILDIRENLIG